MGQVQEDLHPSGQNHRKIMTARNSRKRFLNSRNAALEERYALRYHAFRFDDVPGPAA
jgi:hypothetical protein